MAFRLRCHGALVITLTGVQILGVGCLAAAPFTQANVGVCFGRPGCTAGNDQFSVTSGPLQFQRSYVAQPDGAQLSVAALAEATYGTLHVGADARFNIPGAPATAVLLSEAIFQDDITISSPTRNGTLGMLRLSYWLDGEVSKSGNATAFAQVKIVATYGSSIAMYPSSVSGTYSTNSPIWFYYGQPFNLNIDLMAWAGSVSADGYLIGFPPVSGQGRGSLDFTRTFSLSGMESFDQSGNAVLDVTFSSSSGTQYSPSGVVPEPTTLSLVVAGLLGALACGWRRCVRRAV